VIRGLRGGKTQIVVMWVVAPCCSGVGN